MTTEVVPEGGRNLPAVGAGEPTGDRRTEFELLAALEIFGVPLDASAKFGPGIDTILQARFGDLSVGQVIEYLVHKAEPSFDFKLSPPWDLLNKINLQSFVFEVDITNRRVGFQYNDIGFKFPLISLNRIEVWFSPRGKGGRKTVDVGLYGSFLGKDYSEAPGLTWDVLSQPPPAVPGKGAKYFDLEYLGLGQHVTLRDQQDLLTMKSIIDALEKSYADIDPAKNPLDSLTSFKFDSASSWLIGTKFSALESATLSAIFNDPYLYGLRVALDGKRVGKLAGLEFEIVYKRINDHLGLYYFELKLPDVIRKIQAGQVNITLPIIDIEIYTNGNFKIDLGFPVNLNFSRSAAIDFIVWVGPVPVPITGSAGLYFGVLSSESSPQLPAITNGTFAPALVAGFGMRLGLGYSIQVGILDAGFFVGFFGIFEGELAFFQPDSPSTGKAVYFRVSATVGIMGHIWGTVNFAILKASVDICAYASAQLVIEVHMPIEVVFEAGVTVRLRVKVLFIHITLSFHANIRKSFQMGSATPTAWLLASSQDRSAGVASRQGLRHTPQGLVANAMYASVLSEDFRVHASRHVQLMMSVAGAPPAKTTIPLYLQPMNSAGLTDDRPPSLAEAPPLVVANADAPVINEGVAVTVAGHLYTTVAGDTFAKIATATEATLAQVAAGVATTAGLLTADAVLEVPQGAGSYTIKDGDTLASILVALPGAALLVEQVAMLVIGSHGAMWEALAVANATAPGIINAGVKLQIGDKSHTTTDTDTFTTIATALDVTVPVLADAVKDTPGLLTVGVSLNAPTGTALLDGGNVVVAAGDTLASIAARLLSPFEQLARSAFEWSVVALEQVKQHVNGGVAAAGEGDEAEVTRSDLNASSSRPSSTCWRRNRSSS
jgi:LysM repeat protein